MHLCSFTLQKPILTKASKRTAKCRLSPETFVGSPANRIALGAHFSHPGAFAEVPGHQIIPRVGLGGMRC